MRTVLALTVAAVLAGCYQPRDDMARSKPVLMAPPARPLATDMIDLGDDGRVHIITFRTEFDSTRCLVYTGGGVTCLPSGLPE
jgi:hypothetical protein